MQRVFTIIEKKISNKKLETIAIIQVNMVSQHIVFVI